VDDFPITVRYERPVVARIDTQAAYSGNSRSGWLRLAAARSDSEITLEEIEEVRGREGELPTEMERTRQEAEETLALVKRAMRPKPLPL
jgi:hypothetical protein